MITIVKTKEPNSWTEHRLTPGAEYEAIPELRESLIKDQGYICAYCMRRISLDSGDTRIDHIIPQSELTKEEAMDYSNMVICCNGCMSGTEEANTHCDRHKKDRRICFSPFDTHLVEKITYKSDGTITSLETGIYTDLNSTLNLNILFLKLNRKNARNGLIKQLGKNTWKKSDLEKIYRIYSEKDSEGKYKEYCGVILDYISKKLRKIGNKAK